MYSAPVLMMVPYDFLPIRQAIHNVKVFLEIFQQLVLAPLFLIKFRIFYSLRI